MSCGYLKVGPIALSVECAMLTHCNVMHDVSLYKSAISLVINVGYRGVYVY